jgi:hypothetical protein
VYVRRGARTSEHALPPHPVLDFSTMEHRRAMADAIGVLGVDLAAGTQ